MCVLCCVQNLFHICMACIYIPYRKYTRRYYDDVAVLIKEVPFYLSLVMCYKGYDIRVCLNHIKFVG